MDGVLWTVRKAMTYKNPLGDSTGDSTATFAADVSASAPQKLAMIRESIAAAARGVARPAADICLIAVSKTHPVADVRPFLQVGQRDFGENRIQEATAKWPSLRMEFPHTRLHYIGRLQSNKAAAAMALFDVIHTVDRPSLVTALARVAERCTLPLPILLIQVNIGAEAQKSGCALADLSTLLANAQDAGLAIGGLMAIPPLAGEVAPYFALLDDLAARYGLAWRSMGMSDDYPTAIALGATHIRVGTALFGARLA